MRVLYAIFARGGSKSIPKKNLQRVGGLSLVGYKARSARRAASCTRLVISTDSVEIQYEARRFGVEAPFLRPDALATDTASTDEAVVHLLEWIEEYERTSYDALMILEPSSPFATAEDYDQAVELMRTHSATVVLGMREVEVSTHFVGPIEDDGRMPSIVRKVQALDGLRRQDQRPEYTMNGAFYLVDWEYFKTARSRYRDPENTFGLVMPRSRSIEIDEPIDLDLARFLVDGNHLDTSSWAPEAAT